MVHKSTKRFASTRGHWPALQQLIQKQRILYNDYPRYIISRNPPRVDQDGDIVDSENENSDLDTTDAEDDPYRDVKVESEFLRVLRCGLL